MRQDLNYYLFVLLVVQQFMIQLVKVQCPARKIVLFDEVRPETRTPLFCALTEANATQYELELTDCSYECAESDVCVGFNYNEHQLVCELFQTQFSALTLTQGCTYYEASPDA